MFKINSFSEEIAKSMEKNLIANQQDSKTGFSKLAKAVDLLDKSASILDSENFIQESDYINSILESLDK